MPYKTFKIYTLGCKVNQYDSGALSHDLEKSGLKRVSENADLAVVNTCAVTQTAVRKDIRMLNTAKKENPSAKIAVIGCWPQISRNKTGLDNDILTLGTNKREELLAFLTGRKQNIGCWADYSSGGRSRYFLKVQDGCQQFCSYCIIPYARGGLKSKPLEAVMAEARKAVADGYREIVLCGIHLGMYGVENRKQKTESRKKPEVNLSRLLDKLVKIRGMGRVRLSSIEINEVGDDIIGLIKNSQGKICPHLHLPLQSGSDKVLKAMNRPYDTGRFEEKIKKIRQHIPDAAITTDVITGFPGESEIDFKQTYQFIKTARFSRLHVFPFSAHPLAPASAFKGQLGREPKLERAGKLRRLGWRLAEDYRSRFKGRTLDLLIEKIDDKGVKGKTQYYFDATLKTKDINKTMRPLKTGKIIKLRM